MQVFIANFGRQNYEWPVCKERGTVATMYAVSVQHLWEARDRTSYVENRMAHDLTAAGNTPTRATASRWFNLMTTVSETVGDIWVHKDGDELWWTESRSIAPEFETKTEPIDRGREVVICHKKCDPWKSQSRTGNLLRWNELHPKAKDFLSTEATLQSLSAPNRAYTLALINGEGLSEWHNTPFWKARAEAAKHGFSQVKYGTQVDKIAYQRASDLFELVSAAERMARTTIAITNSARGQTVERIVKRKDLGFVSAALTLTHRANPPRAKTTRCDLHHFAQKCDWPFFFPDFDEREPHRLWPAKKIAAFFSTSLSSRKRRTSLRRRAFSLSTSSCGPDIRS